MTNRERPDQTLPVNNPATQSGEDHGTIKSQQRTGHTTKVVDTPRGSEVSTRKASGHRI